MTEGGRSGIITVLLFRPMPECPTFDLQQFPMLLVDHCAVEGDPGP